MNDIITTNFEDDEVAGAVLLPPTHNTNINTSRIVVTADDTTIAHEWTC